MNGFNRRADSATNSARAGPCQHDYRNEPALGEQALKLRLESFVDGVLYYRRNVAEPAQQLARLSRADQERFLDGMEFIVNTSIELAYNFCQFAPSALTIIDKDTWQIWLLHLLEVYDEGGVIAAVATMQDAKRYANSIGYAGSLVRL